MSEPDREPTEKPTTSKEEAEAETKWMTRNWIGIAVVSILGLWLLVLGAMQATGLVDIFAPIADSGAAQWGVFFAMAVVLIILAGWSWKAIAS
ncbi:MULTISPECIES: hypothetical protein [Haloterrigena]|uniref:Uncharacterized protein n=2 Tax=Haloterrigena TaxID=121871 RepID=M0C855_9EURY|nr:MULTISPECIES: hypothetical protein [Haloterrigena]ELZ18813.1 hypothetical protein C477_09879 [Haloterrigena salina JCM 13891]QRV14131.1 hypothetical protein JMJ58_14410 [Haloterrigena salifodinae]